MSLLGKNTLRAQIDPVSWKVIWFIRRLIYQILFSIFQRPDFSIQSTSGWGPFWALLIPIKVIGIWKGGPFTSWTYSPGLKHFKGGQHSPRKLSNQKNRDIRKLFFPVKCQYVSRYVVTKNHTRKTSLAGPTKLLVVTNSIIRYGQSPCTCALTQIQYSRMRLV